ncbi:glutamate receptor ionotropic, kainate glr-3-like [Mytilus trossulus]|uniref:glutamate receptor ionotropic, kainate glr-3-like n=1 Tax=Mytilus trossulus TaxID=6551 RepID=UPI0030040BB7
MSPQTHTTEAIVIVSVLKYSGWRDIVLLHDNTTAQTVTQVTDILTRAGVFVIVYNIDLYTECQLTAILSSLKVDPIDSALDVTLMCTVNSSITVLHSARDFHNKYVEAQLRVRHISKWIIFSDSNFSQDDLSSFNLDNIVFLNLLSEKQNQKLAYCEPYMLQTLMWTKSGRQLSNIGAVSDKGVESIYGELFPNTKNGFNGRMLRVTTLEWGAMTIIQEDGNFTGLCFDILNEMARRLNFTYSVIIPPDGAFGAELPNGTWTGMVGMIQSEQADLVVSSLTINPDRERVIDFTYPFLFDHVTVVYAKPGERKWRTLIKPFETSVIVMIGVSLIAMSFIYCLQERGNPIYHTVSKRQSPGLYHSFWYMYGALLSQGGEPLPVSLAGRTIVSGWWIFCIVSIAVYSGNLTASLAVHKTKLPFTSLEEMVKQKEFKWGTLGSSAFQTVFKDSAVPTYAAIWNGIVEFNKSDPSVLSKSGEEHLQKLYSGNYAFIMAKQYIDFETAGHCNLVLLNEHMARNEVAFALANNSPFVRILSNAQIFEVILPRLSPKR